MSAYVGKFFTAVSAALEFNSATLSGAMDIVVIEDIKGNRKSSPFHVRFGKLQLLKSRGIPIQVDLNGRPTPLRMLLGAAGEAYFYNPPLDASSSGDSPKLSQTFDSDPSVSLPLPDVEFKADDKSSSNTAIPDQSGDVAVPIRAVSLPATKKSEEHNSQLRIQPAVLTTSSKIHVNAQVSEPTLSVTTAIDQCGPEANNPVDASFEPLSYASDSEVELSRTQRGDDSHFVVDAPLSPPLFRSRCSWTPSDIPSGTKLNGPSQNRSVFPSPMQLSSSPVASVEPPLPTSTSATTSQIIPSHSCPPSEGLNPILQKDNKIQSDDGSVSCQPEANEFESTALFDLPAMPSRKVPDSPAGLVTMSSSMYDVVGEEERKLDARSLDSFDVDGNDCSSSTDGLQQRVCRILANDNALAFPQAAWSQDVADPTQAVDVPASDTDPPSDRDETLALSLCGGLLNSDMQEAQVVELFERHRVMFDDFEANPSMVFHPSLRFRIENRIVELRTVAPFLVAALAYNERMNLDSLAEAIAMDEEKLQSGESKEPPKSPPTPRRFRWFGWSASPPVVGEPLLKEEEISALDAENTENDPMAGGCDLPREIPDTHNVTSDNNDLAMSKDEGTISEKSGDALNVLLECPDESKNGCDTVGVTPEGGIVETSDVNIGTVDGRRELENEGEKVAIPGKLGIVFTEVDPEHLSFCPTMGQLNALDLETGANTLRFYVEGTTVELQCRIFLWECHSKVVISDVDGTITRSDVLGHLLPAVGRDWSQVGVAGLYTMIEKNGYKMLYLTARPIGQASQTRAFLHNVTQGNSKLPNGPVLMSPNRLVESFTREVIRRRPHEFKISALREVRNLFSPDHNPFHAGFGNRDTDVISYRAVGLMPHRIFVVNPRGELVVMKARFESTGSYSSLQDLVESVFPDITGGGGHEEVRALTENASYNNWNFWRAQLPSVDIDNLISRR